DWAGPPAIHNRMQDLCLSPCLAAALARSASTPNQPDADAPSTPAADSRSQSRRETSSRNMVLPSPETQPRITRRTRIEEASEENRPARFVLVLLRVIRVIRG